MSQCRPGLVKVSWTCARRRAKNREIFACASPVTCLNSRKGHEVTKWNILSLESVFERVKPGGKEDQVCNVWAARTELTSGTYFADTCFSGERRAKPPKTSLVRGRQYRTVRVRFSFLFVSLRKHARKNVANIARVSPSASTKPAIDQILTRATARYL